MFNVMFAVEELAESF